MQAEPAAAIRQLIATIAQRHSASDEGKRRVLVGLVGRGIGSSRSPLMHEREGQRLGLCYRYGLIDFDRHGLGDGALAEVIRVAAKSGFAGLNVTHPFKQSVVAHLSELSPEARAIGAVNTVVFRDGRRIGHNTDWWGFAESFKAGLKAVPQEEVVQFGAGGAGAAVGYALLELGTAFLEIYDPDKARASQLAGRLRRQFRRDVVPLSDPGVALRRAAGAVNATPVGMEKYPGLPFDPLLLSPRQWVAEIIYFPAETELLRRARAQGCRTLDGTGMAIFQALKAFELFTGMTPDREAMAQHFAAAA